MRTNTRKFGLALTTLTLLVLLLAVFGVVSVWAATINVNPGDSIQAAIDAADSGDTINVAAGTYTVASTIVVNKSLTILGPQAGVDPRPCAGTTRTSGSPSEAVIDGGGTLGTIIYIAADDVTLDGLEITNGTDDLVKSDSPSVARATIRNCIVHGSSGDEGIQLKHSTDSLIECCVAYDVRQDGFNMAYSSGGTIRNCEVYNSSSENAAIYIYDSSDMTVECNYIHDTQAANGVMFYKNYGSTHIIANNLIIHNSWWGGKHCYDEADGNAINIYKPRVASTYVVKHNTLDDNTPANDCAKPGNAIYVRKQAEGVVVNVNDSIVTNHNGYGIRTWSGATVNYRYNDLWQNALGATDGNPVDGGGNISADPLYNPDYTLGTGSPATGAASDGKDMGVIFPPRLVPMASFVIDHTKLDFKKKADDDKVRVQGKLELGANSNGVEISEDVIVTVGPLSETITMVEKGKKGDKWEYKRPKGDTGDIKHMSIDWKNGKFDIRMDKADLTGVTNPVTISIRIGDDVGSESILMKEHKHHWDYKVNKPKAVEIEPFAIADQLQVVAYPNPIRDVHTATFQVMGTMAAEVEEIRVQIYDLSGHLVWEDGALGSELDWHTDSLSGDYLANGIYLYRVQVRIGGSWINQDIGKIAVLR